MRSKKTTICLLLGIFNFVGIFADNLITKYDANGNSVCVWNYQKDNISEVHAACMGNEEYELVDEISISPKEQFVRDVIFDMNLSRAGIAVWRSLEDPEGNYLNAAIFFEDKWLPSIKLSQATDGKPTNISVHINNHNKIYITWHLISVNPEDFDQDMDRTVIGMANKGNDGWIFSPVKRVSIHK